jgi:hypothetical protein
MRLSDMGNTMLRLEIERNGEIDVGYYEISP